MKASQLLTRLWTRLRAAYMGQGSVLRPTEKSVVTTHKVISHKLNDPNAIVTVYHSTGEIAWPLIEVIDGNVLVLHKLRPDLYRVVVVGQTGEDYAYAVAKYTEYIKITERDPEWHDPTHGMIDRDIQEYVARQFPGSPKATVTAIESTIQDKRKRGVLAW